MEAYLKLIYNEGIVSWSTRKVKWENNRFSSSSDGEKNKSMPQIKILDIKRVYVHIHI